MATINLDSTTLPTQLPTYEGKCCRGEHGQDQDWISCRILAIFSDQDWIWILIFEKNLIRRGYLFDLYNEISLGVNQEVKNDGGSAFFLSCYGLCIHKKSKLFYQEMLHSSQSMMIRVTLSQFFSREVEVVTCLCNAGMLCCFVCCAERLVCVV